MENETEKNEITICVGSSCFSRGNNKNLEIIKQYIADEGLDSEINLKGCLCREQCNMGPNIVINDEVFHQVDPNTIIDILNHTLMKEKKL